ncbi:MAG: 2-C-methyl-D-erythritol 4-phosphate cytidylyltransferase, partial [Bacteroidales bacterium]|nr:2-C-methyl-D-erythritol 4-phosphate cytidylyltransferase [Bacteroidales bacterium]
RLLSCLPSPVGAGKASMVVAIHPDDRHWPHLPLAADTRIHTVTGGDERADSVRAGLRLLAGRAAADDWVLVHDVARPCITSGDIGRLVATLGDDPVGGILAAPVSDTLKRVDDHARIQGTQERSHLWAAMTPQMFRYGLLCRALEAAAGEGLAVTDESSAVEALGLAPKVVMGRRDNIKITRREDLAVAEAILVYQQKNPQSETV